MGQKKNMVRMMNNERGLREREREREYKKGDSKGVVELEQE